MTETIGLNVEPTVPLDSGQKLGAFQGLFPHFTTDDSIVEYYEEMIIEQQLIFSCAATLHVIMYFCLFVCPIQVRDIQYLLNLNQTKQCTTKPTKTQPNPTQNKTKLSNINKS